MFARLFPQLFGAAALLVASLAFTDDALAAPFYQGPKTCQECHRDEFKA